MHVKRFFEPLVAQSSYLIGCVACGEAIVIDPNRDVDQYIRAAAQEKLRITYVTETHIHADFLSGARELARITGATLCVSDEGDANWKYQFASEGRLIRHGDRLQVGRVGIEVVHTPGHTPEHLTFLITDGAAADRAIAACTGDFIFVGDVGRPDLLERAANIMGTMEASARTLWRSLQAFSTHEDWLQIWPGHGAGSACGKGISAIPHSTLGYERLFNWAFQVKTEADFVTAVLAGQPEPPKYFATMKRMNKEGPALLGGFRAPPRLDDSALPDLLAQRAVVIDTRPAAEHAAGSVPGTLSIPLDGSFVTWAGWLIPYTADIYLIADAATGARMTEAVRALALIGLDRVAGFFGASSVEAAARAGLALGSVPQVTVAELAPRLAAGEVTVLDVRNATEWAEGHLPSALHIPLGYLADHVADVPTDRPVVVQCRSGSRSHIAASLLRKMGHARVINLVGGIQAWEAAGQPVVHDVVAEGAAAHA